MRKYIDFQDLISDDLEATMSGSAYIAHALEWLDEFSSRNPDQVPGRTITESEKADLADVLACERRESCVPNDADRHSVNAVLKFLGILVVPDPVPTPRQRLEALIFKAWGDRDDAQNIAAAIVAEFDVSVKAPGGDE